MQYPLPPQAAAAFVGSVRSAVEEREGSQSLQHAEDELQAATAAAAPTSAFAQPSVQGSGSADVAQANQLLGKVRKWLQRPPHRKLPAPSCLPGKICRRTCMRMPAYQGVVLPCRSSNIRSQICDGSCCASQQDDPDHTSLQVDQYLDRSANESGRVQSTELLQTAVRQAQQLLTRVWTWVLSLLGFGPSTSSQVSSALPASLFIGRCHFCSATPCCLTLQGWRFALEVVHCLVLL